MIPAHVLAVFVVGVEFGEFIHERPELGQFIDAHVSDMGREPTGLQCEVSPELSAVDIATVASGYALFMPI